MRGLGGAGVSGAGAASSSVDPTKEPRVAEKVAETARELARPKEIQRVLLIVLIQRVLLIVLRLSLPNP